MFRLFVCLGVAVCLSAGVALAADPAKKKKKKAAAAVSGEVVKVDAEKGTVTLKVPGKKKQPAEEKEFKVTPETAVSEVKELKADKVADLLKTEPFKVGSTARVEAGDEGAAKSITLGGPAAAAKRKKKQAK